MDSKFSFLDQDGLFDGHEAQATAQPAQPAQATAQPAQPQQPAQARAPQRYGAAPQPTVPRQGPAEAAPQASIAQALDGIAHALSYVEKRVASCEHRILAALEEERKRPPPSPGLGGWGIALAGVLGLVLIAALIGALRRGAPAPTPPLYVRSGPFTAPAPYAPLPPAGPPQSFL